MSTHRLSFWFSPSAYRLVLVSWSILCIVIVILRTTTAFSTTTTSVRTTTMSSSSTYPLQDQVICITGASSGIGAAIALKLYQQGAKIAIGARRKALLDDVAAQMTAQTTTDESFPGQVLAVECDVVDRASVQHFVQTTCEHYGVSSLSTMIACAGVMYFTEMKNALMDQWDQTIDVNCKGVTNCFGTCIPAMVEAGHGKIITITSDAGVRPFPNLAVYCASKHFCEVLTEITRRELVGTGVTLHTIQPGDVQGTELILNNSDTSAAEQMGVVIGQPVGVGMTRTQLLDPIDVADAVLYVLTAPPHVGINTVLIEARDQA
jgi:NADP-dependent 3-hydroxy acid dehydrogenase YdfG